MQESPVSSCLEMSDGQGLYSSSHYFNNLVCSLRELNPGAETLGKYICALIPFLSSYQKRNLPFLFCACETLGVDG